MKKLIFGFLLGCFSLNCFAYTSWYANGPTCTPYGGDITGCFLNNTKGKIDKLSFMIANYYTNGYWERSIANLGANEPNFYTAASTSKSEMKNKKIDRIEFSIVEGDAQYPKMVPGCIMEISSNSPSKTILVISKEDGRLHC